MALPPMGTRVLMLHKPRLQSSKAIEERGATATKTIEVQTKGMAATPLESDLEGAKGSKDSGSTDVNAFLIFVLPTPKAVITVTQIQQKS